MFLTLIALASQPTLASRGTAARHTLGTVYSQTTYEAACSDIPVVIRFGNDMRRNRWGLVTSVQVAGKEVAGAAKRLTDVAVDRVIDRIGIMNCGYDPANPVIKGVMGAAGPPRVEPNLYFTIKKENGAWVFSDDGVRALK